MGHSSFVGGNGSGDGKIVAPSAVGVSNAKPEGSSVASNGTIDASGKQVPHEVPSALSARECAEIVNEFENSALLAQAAGFDGIEVHAGSGYLIDTFLQSCSNERTDRYGIAELGGANSPSNQHAMPRTSSLLMVDAAREHPELDEAPLRRFSGRYQLLKEILRKLVRIFPNRVGVKISPNSGFNGMGSADNHAFFSYLLTELRSFPQKA